MKAKEYFETGHLAEAIDAASAAVKANPMDMNARGFLCELLCFAGNFDRADMQLDAIGKMDAQAMMGVLLYRQLIRAEQSRQQFYNDGRLPTFIGMPTENLKLHLEASVSLRAGDLAKANELLAEAEEKRLKPTGTCNGKAFTDFRDADDLTAPFFEVLTSNGKYYWIPIEQVESIEFKERERPWDVLWRRVAMVVNGGPDGEVFLPAIYVGSAAQDDNQIKLGRATDWLAEEGQPVRGLGQRTYFVAGENEEGISIHELETLEFENPQAVIAEAPSAE